MCERITAGILAGRHGNPDETAHRKLAGHDVIAIDSVSDGIPVLDYVTAVVGDLCDERLAIDALACECDAVVHLATVPEDEAERNPELARRVNVDAAMVLADAAARTGGSPRFGFTSSIPVLGRTLPAAVSNDRPTAPTIEVPVTE